LHAQSKSNQKIALKLRPAWEGILSDLLQF